LDIQLRAPLLILFRMEFLVVMAITVYSKFGQ